MSVRLYAQHRARVRFARNLELLELELAMHSPRRHLDVLVELLELLVEQTGKSNLTPGYREQLANAKQRVTSRGNLRLVQ